MRRHVPAEYIVFMFLITTAFGSWAEDCVPSLRRAEPSVTSPNHRYRVDDVVCATDAHRNTLVLRDVKTGSRRTLHPYPRYATALWSLDSHYVAISDYAGSDHTENLVYSIDKNESPIDLQEQLDRGLSEHDRELPETDHFYVSVIRWRSDKKVELLVWGHGGGKGFCRRYLLSLAGKASRRSLRKPKSSDPEDYCEKIKR